METDMQHLQAPQENIQTWNRVTRLIFVSLAAIAALLIVMAATLL